jgi:hypothetical protein
VHLKAILSVLAALVAAVVLVSASGAGTGKVRSARIDVSTRAAVVHYLRSIHLNPSGVVIQRGARNYAGSRCPGKAWSCTSTRHPVVQVAAPGGKNTFTCSTAHCAVVQVATATAATNTAKCIKTSGALQACFISQSSSSADNRAIVVETTSTSGLAQLAALGAEIRQRATGASNSNTACVLQTVNANGSTSTGGSNVSVVMEAHQAVRVVQDSKHGGNSVQNASAASGGTCVAGALTQGQTLTSNVKGTGSITQRQNAVNLGPTLGANVWLDIEQNQSSGFFGTATGPNSAVFNQTNTLTAVANTSVGPVRQTQSSVNGGILAKVNQDSRDVSTAIATQTETQCEDAHLSAAPFTCDTATADPPPGYSLTQTQFGPVRKGGGDSVQTGNSGDTFTITQSSKQDNDTGSGQTNVVQGDCHTDGNCTVAQTTTVQGETTTNVQSGQDIDTTTSCTGSDCNTTCNGSSCTTFTESGSQLTATNTEIAEFGYGGMRGDGTGSITVSGVTGVVTKALLYWNGPTSSNNPAANAAVTFNGTPVVGTNIGVASSNCWGPGFTNSHSYRADVTGLVSSNGSYSLADFVKADADINGVGLVVFFNDGNPNNWRNVVLWNGNDSNVTTSDTLDGWDETLTGVPYPGSGSASLDFIVSDGQTFTDDALVLNGTPIVPSGAIFQGDSTPAGPFDASGDLWDVKSYPITGSLTVGLNTLRLTTGLMQDCLSLVVAAANVPVSAPVVIGSPQVALAHHAAVARRAPARAPKRPHLKPEGSTLGATTRPLGSG